MGLGVTILFYGMLGMGVAIAGLLREPDGSRTGRVLRFATTAAFWPVYVPVLLAAAHARDIQNVPTSEPDDGLAAMITQVQGELDAALASLDGWAEDALDRERHHIAELKAAWLGQANRIRQMDRLLDRSRHSTAPAFDGARTTEIARLRESDQARVGNLARIDIIRQQAYRDLMATLAWVRELATMIHLAKFSGAPAARADELVTQIAAAVEGLTEVTSWQGGTEPTARESS